MAFHGLFIGIDRYQSPGINELSCARRDATALEALFADTLGGTTVLLADGEATRRRIEAEFASLATCAPDDTVVVAFSGHGSETHELVTHDADLVDLPKTAVPLDLLQDWFSRIPAKRLILFLDCCFSGGIGAKVLHIDAKARDLLSTEARLAQLAGSGRIIFTASAANEPAYEHRRFGHGFLTNFLLEALRGAEGVASGGKLSLYRLLEHVTARVKAAALQIGRPQNPTMRGSIDGDVEWPVFVMGAKFQAAFPARIPSQVNSDLTSLASAGFPPSLIAAWGRLRLGGVGLEDRLPRDDRVLRESAGIARYSRGGAHGVLGTNHSPHLRGVGVSSVGHRAAGAIHGPAGQSDRELRQ
jgi:helicase